MWNVSKWKKMKRFKFLRRQTNKRKQEKPKENTNKYLKLSLLTVSAGLVECFPRLLGEMSEVLMMQMLILLKVKM